MGILVTLPLVAPLLFYAALRRYGHEWRAAAIIAATFWGIAVTLITEILSVWNGVAVAWLAAAWLLMIALASCYLYRAMGGLWVQRAISGRGSQSGYAIESLRYRAGSRRRINRWHGRRYRRPLSAQHDGCNDLPHA